MLVEMTRTPAVERPLVGALRDFRATLPSEPVRVVGANLGARRVDGEAQAASVRPKPNVRRLVCTHEATY